MDLTEFSRGSGLIPFPHPILEYLHSQPRLLHLLLPHSWCKSGVVAILVAEQSLAVHRSNPGVERAEWRGCGAICGAKSSCRSPPCSASRTSRPLSPARGFRFCPSQGEHALALGLVLQPEPEHRAGGFRHGARRSCSSPWPITRTASSSRSPAATSGGFGPPVELRATPLEAPRPKDGRRTVGSVSIGNGQRTVAEADRVAPSPGFRDWWHVRLGEFRRASRSAATARWVRNDLRGNEPVARCSYIQSSAWMR